VNVPGGKVRHVRSPVVLLRWPGRKWLRKAARTPAAASV
jgi:hypothetical protein